MTVPSGYTALGPVRFDTGNGEIGIVAIKQYAVTISAFVNRGSTAGHSGTCSRYMVCVKTGMIKIDS